MTQCEAILQSCATCEATIRRLLFPIWVTPPPFPVPRWIVTCSRMILLSPMKRTACSPRNLRSCGAVPMTEKGKSSFSLPILVRFSIVT